jgi:hypothetical protein
MPRKVTHVRVEPDPNRRLLTLEEAMDKLGGTSRSNLYALFARGALTPIKLGRRTYLASDQLDGYIAQLFAAA